MRLRGPNRRTYLHAVIAGMSALAGCSTDRRSASEVDVTDVATETPEKSSEESGEASSEEHDPGLELIDVIVEEDSIAVGDSVEVTALVRNTADAEKRYEASLKAGDNAVTRATDVPAGDESKLVFDLQFGAPGTVELTINDTGVTELTVNERSVFYVSVDGDDSNTGAESDPLRTVQQGLTRAQPGHTVEVTPGEYHEGDSPRTVPRTVRDGDPDAPITITGPEDAILRPSLQIRHSHIRLTGLTIEGLLDPDNPDDVESYYHGAESYPVYISPSHDADEYLRDIVCAPHGVGHGAIALIKVLRTKDLEIGPLKITGMAGASWILPDEPDKHAGEIIYLGSPGGVVFEDYYPWHGLDHTENVHIHHIDNSEGHPHSELVDAKLGTRNVLIEYCTDGGAQTNDPYYGCSIGLRSYDATVRWCELRGGDGHGIKVTDPTEWVNEHDDPVFDPDDKPNNSIYGNTLEGFAATVFDIHTDLADQGTICGNEYAEPDDIEEPTDPQVAESCPVEIPEGEGIGHLGGNSPWTSN